MQTEILIRVTVEDLRPKTERLDDDEMVQSWQQSLVGALEHPYPEWADGVTVRASVES